MDVSEIDIQQAQLLLEAGTATFVDVRDPDSFRAEHIPGAIHLDDSNVQQFVAGADKQAAVVVYCYHGNSSLGATAFFAVPFGATGGIVGNVGEPVISVVILAACTHITRKFGR